MPFVTDTRKRSHWRLAAVFLLPLVMCVPANAQRPEDAFEKGRAALADEEWSWAADSFREFLRENPASEQAPEARFWAGYCLVQEGEGDGAIQLLRPFESLLADNKWADDALLNLGTAYEYNDELDLALAVWKRLQEKYPNSVWRPESLRNMIYLLFYRTKNYDKCHFWCEKFLAKFPDNDANEEFRLIGARCLNALGRFDEANKWIEQWFHGEEARDEVLRRILLVQQALVKGESDTAMEQITEIESDFPDLHRDEWTELMVELSNVLASHEHVKQSRELLTSLVLKMGNRDIDAADFVLSELIDTYDTNDDDDGDADPTAEIVSVLDELAEAIDSSGVRVEIRLLQTEWLAGEDKLKDAIELIQTALSRKQPPFARCRLTLRLSDLLVENDQPANAIAIVKTELEHLERRDLVQQLQNQIDELKSQNHE